MIILATRLGPHTGESILILTLAAPVAAFLLCRGCRPLIRIGIALTVHALAFAVAIDLGVRRRDMIVHGIVEMLRFHPPSFTDDFFDASLLYLFVFLLLVLPAICAVLMVYLPLISKAYLYWIPLLVALLFLSIFVAESIRLHLRSFLEGIALSVAFGLVGLLMRNSPVGKGGEPGEVVNSE